MGCGGMAARSAGIRQVRLEAGHRQLPDSYWDITQMLISRVSPVDKVYDAGLLWYRDVLMLILYGCNMIRSHAVEWRSKVRVEAE
jgi:hypothetical protein